MSLKLLETIYSQINILRQNGTKMKDIANYVNLPSSVLSALYSTVLPTYLNNLKSQTEEQALDYAISQVNNVSKKRLLASIDEIYLRLETFNSNKTIGEDLFIHTLDKFARKTDDIAYSYLGTYVSYSLSSSKDALKMEPFILINEDNREIKAIRKSAYNSINTGMAVVNHGHSLSLMLNESDNSQLALVTIYLQLPFYEKAKFLRGIYMTLDYNRNPIARRIIFTKISNEDDMQIFESLEGGILTKENFSPEQQIYYNYTCQSSDYIKMCAIPSPKLNEEDLITEKKILGTT